MNADHEIQVDDAGVARFVDGARCSCDPFACALVATAVAAFTATPTPAGRYLVRVGDDGNVERWARA